MTKQLMCIRMYFIWNFKSPLLKSFFSFSLSNFAHKCFDYGEDNLMGTELQIFVLGGSILYTA